MASKKGSSAAAAVAPIVKGIKIQVYQGAASRGTWTFSGNDYKNKTEITLQDLKNAINADAKSFMGNPETKDFRTTRDGEPMEDTHVFNASCNVYVKNKEGAQSAKESKAPAAPALKVKNANKSDADAPVSISLDRTHNKVIVEMGSAELAETYFNSLLEKHNMKEAVQSATEQQLKQLATLTGTSVKDLADRLGMTITEGSPTAAAKPKAAPAVSKPKAAPAASSAAAAAAAEPDEEEEEEGEDDGQEEGEEGEDDGQEEGEEEEEEPPVVGEEEEPEPVVVKKKVSTKQPQVKTVGPYKIVATVDADQQEEEETLDESDIVPKYEPPVRKSDKKGKK